MKKRILLFGCQQITQDIIDVILKSNHELVGVITHDEKRDLLFSDKYVQDFCFERGISTIRIPDDVKVKEYTNILKSLEPDIIFSTYYRRLLPKEILDIPPMGCVNLHPSLLPKDRGPNPTYWNVRRGDMVAGATLHYIDEGMDTGDIIAQKQTGVYGSTGFMLNKNIMNLGIKLFKENFDDIILGRNNRYPQDNKLATCNIKFINNMRYINWCQPAENIVNHVRAHASPYNPSLTLLYGKKVSKVSFDRLEVLKRPRSSGGPGSFVVDNSDLIIQTYDYPVLARAHDWKSFLASGMIIDRGYGRFSSGVPE